jgi:hypothetical protein
MDLLVAAVELERFDDPPFTNNYFNNLIENIEKGDDVLPFDISNCEVMGDWTANSKHYDQSKATTFKRLLNSIAEYGGQHLGQLGRLNKIDLKHISAILKLENVLFSVEKEFNKKGEFHAVMNHILEKNRQEITDYGGKKKKAYMNPEADEKMLKALQNGSLRPYHNYIDLVKVVLFCLARFFCLRGGNELCMALIDQFRIGRYCTGPDAGLRTIEYVNEKYKHRYLSLQRCYLSSNT